MVLKEYVLRGMASAAWSSRRALLVGQCREELENLKFGSAISQPPMTLLLRDEPQAFCSYISLASIAASPHGRANTPSASSSANSTPTSLTVYLRDRIQLKLETRRFFQHSAVPALAVGDRRYRTIWLSLQSLHAALKPGIFKTLKEFRVAYMTAGKPRQPANPQPLCELMRGAMICNTRAVVVAVNLPRRHTLPPSKSTAAQAKPRPTPTSRWHGAWWQKATATAVS